VSPNIHTQFDKGALYLVPNKHTMGKLNALDNAKPKEAAADFQTFLVSNLTCIRDSHNNFN
jgi:hypothetical protein